MYFSLFLSRGDLRIPGLPRCRVRHFAGFSHVVFHAGFYLKGKDSVALLSTYKVLKQSPYLDALPSRMLRIVIRYAPIKAIHYKGAKLKQNNLCTVCTRNSQEKLVFEMV